MNPNVTAERSSGGGSPDDRSLSELTKQLTDQASALAQKEIELAKAELALKGKRLGIGRERSAPQDFSAPRSVPSPLPQSWRSRSFSTLGSPLSSLPRATERSRGFWR
jgi:hypothetical protein